MKKILFLGMAIVLAASLTACGSNNAPTKGNDKITNDSSNETKGYTDKTTAETANVINSNGGPIDFLKPLG